MEKHNNPSPLWTERGLDWLTSHFKPYYTAFAASLIFGLLGYGFTITNKLVNHDEVASLFSKGGSLELGRWGLDILERIFPNFSMPWIYGIITIVLISLGVCVLCQAFRIQNRLFQILLAGSIAVFPSLTSTMAYIFTSSSYGVAILCVCIAIALLRSPNLWKSLLALGLLVFSLSIYQAYISLAVSLLLVLLMQSLLDGSPVKGVFYRGLFYLGMLILALAAYFMATQLFLTVLGRSLGGYAQGSMDLDFFALPEKIALAYQTFLRFFTQGYRGLMPTVFSRVLHWVILAGAAAMLILWGCSRKKLEWGRIGLMLVLLALLPLGINCMYLFTTEDAVHTLVLYGFVAVYVFAIVLTQQLLGENSVKLPQSIAANCLTIAMAFVVCSNIYTANAVSLNLHLRYENAYAFYTALTANIQRTPGFQEGTKLAVVGNYQNPDFYFEHFGCYDQLTGTTGFLPDNYSKNNFVEYYLGFPVEFATEEESQALRATPEFAAMPCYPYYGSMAFIGDTLVVKLSDERGG